MCRAISRAIVLGVSFAVAATGTSAAAPASQGANQHDEHYCVDAGGGVTICIDIVGVANFIQAPSGIVVSAGRSTFTQTTTGPGGYRESFTQRSSGVFVLKVAGTSHVNHQTVRTEAFLPGAFCTGWSVFTFANGQVRVNLGQFECTPTG